MAFSGNYEIELGFEVLDDTLVTPPETKVR